MTGFGRATSGSGKRGWSAEIRSLNHRYFELSLKVPPSLYGLEDRIRELCQTRIKRGKVTVNISDTHDSDFESVALDEKVIGFYLSTIRKVQRRFRLKGELTISDVLALPRIFSVEKGVEAPEKIWRMVKAPLAQALDRLNQSRAREGQVLLKDFLERIRHIQEILRDVEQRVKNLPHAYYEKLKQRIQDLFKGTEVPQERVWQEAAFLAERADVTEETVRLKNHLELFRRKIEAETEIGKELDFLLQEMNRETNTLGAKAQDFEISKEVVSIKAELEKIREQIQNIE